MPGDAKDHIAGLYTLLAKLPVEEYLFSEKFAAFCKDHDLDDTWKGHWETAQARPDLYGKDTTKNAFILFFHHLFQTKPGEFLEILTGFLQDFQEWNASPLSCAAIKKECLLMGFPVPSVEDEFSKVRMRI